jgi:hypothetical protein
MDKLLRTHTVIRHKIEAFKDRTKPNVKTEMATIKKMLQVQLKAIKLANDQADIVVGQLNAVAPE